MKRSLVFVIALTLLYSVNDANAALTNGLLDTTAVSSQINPTPVGWTVDATRSISGTFNDGASSEPWANTAGAVGDCTGAGCGLFFKPFTGNMTDGDVTVNFYQDNPATPGQKYVLTAYAGAEANYVGIDPTNTTTKSELAVDFLDSSSSMIGGSVLDLKSAGLGTTGLPNSFGYAQYMVMGVAPAGTAFVRALRIHDRCL